MAVKPCFRLHFGKNMLLNAELPAVSAGAEDRPPFSHFFGKMGESISWVVKIGHFDSYVGYKMLGFTWRAAT